MNRTHGRARWTPGARSVLAGAVAVALLGGSCASDGAPRPIRPAFDLHDPDPARRAAAVQEVGRRRDLEHVPALIDLLEDRDGAVRLQAHATLRELTGHDTGYRPYEPLDERARHADAWRAWWAGRAEATP